MNNIEQLIKNMTEPLIEHEDVQKCGQCLRQKIQADVANEFIAAGRVNKEDLKDLFDEVDKRFMDSDLYKRVRSLMKSGKSLDEISKQLAEEGIDI